MHIIEGINWEQIQETFPSDIFFYKKKIMAFSVLTIEVTCKDLKSFSLVL
jgi:hypothetical protein